MVEIKVILNPVAGRGNAGKERELIRQVLVDYHCHFHLEETKEHNEAVEIAKEAAKKGFDLVIAAGGDGTINQVVNGLVGSGIPLGVISCGTGNDFARMIGMPTSISAGIHQILTGDIKWIDLCRVNQRYYVSSVGAGFDGQVAHLVNKGIRFLKGMPAYLFGVFKTLLSHKNYPIRLTVDGHHYEFKSLLVAVNNSTSYGGGIMITPNARIDDGLLEICAAQDLNLFEILSCLPLAVKGSHQNLKKVQMLKGKEVILESEAPLYYQIDGEVLQDQVLRFTIFPRSLPVKGAKFEPSSEMGAMEKIWEAQ